MLPIAIFIYNQNGSILMQEVFSVHEYGQFEQSLLSACCKYQVYTKRTEEC